MPYISDRDLIVGAVILNEAANQRTASLVEVQERTLRWLQMSEEEQQAERDRLNWLARLEYARRCENERQSKRFRSMVVNLILYVPPILMLAGVLYMSAIMMFGM